MSGNEPILCVEQVSKRFGKRSVLANASLELRAGAVTVLLGANGAGKSTLLRLAHGLLRPDAGRVMVCGRDPARAGKAVRRIVGYVPDRPDAPAWMSARELFAFVAPQYPTWDARAAARMAERLRVPLDSPFRALSLGEATKALLVAALAHGPRLLLLDEPFSGLDAPAREELLRCFLEELELDECAVLVTTHDLATAARVADRVALLQDGGIAREGPLEEVLEDGASERALPARLQEMLAGDRSRRVSA